MPVRFCFISIQPSNWAPDFSAPRRPSLFAPRPPRTLVSSFRGAKSSHSRRRISPLALPAASSLCSPLPARPCASVPGSKIFTFPPALFALSAARRLSLFAPLSPLTLVASSRGAKSSHNFQPLSAVSPANRPAGCKKPEAAAPFGAAASFALSRLSYLPVFTVFSSSGFRPALRGLQRMRPSDPDTGLRCCHLR